ncbi:hypothetical protein [Actinophytocola sp.]|uniref:hypothetical protein n=1 Tax=Actinophytocola sp. TaxID=1872138 RepID=UPI002ED986E6
MRLIRLGAATSEVGVDVRAALASWGPGDPVVGGIALAGAQPPDCPRPIDAIIVLPRGIIVVVGIDLPDPAVRLDAPLTAQWKTDGWPLVRRDGAVNPGIEALEAAGAISVHLERSRVEPLPLGTVVAVGPYVSQVQQPTSDLLRGVRVLHPEPMTLLTAARELAVHPRPCTVAQARGLLAALEPDNATVAALDLEAEGFTDTVKPDLGAESTTVLPRVASQPSRAGTAGRSTPAGKRGGSQVRWLPVAAAVLVAMLLLTGIVYAMASSSGDQASGGGTQTTRAQSSTVDINGVSFTPKGSVADTDCAAHAYGDVQVWLERNRCGELVRMRFESTSDDKTAAILVAVLRFPENALAGDLQQVADKPGSGAIVDASAEGRPWPGKRKPFFESAAYTSGREGNSLKLVQAVWIGAPSTPDDETLGKLAEAALDLSAP